MKPSGFTLIELVVVIIVLGILAVVAVPKFIGVTSEVLIVEIQDMEGELKAANKLVFSKAALEGKEELAFNDIHNQVDSSLIINGKKVSLHYGRIQATKWNIYQVMDIDEADWTVLASSGVYAQAYFTPRGAPAFGATSIQEMVDSKCYLKYGFSQEHYKTPNYEQVTSGC